MEPNIPNIFHSYMNEGPFEQCIVCEKSLLDDNTHYFIEKAFQRYDITDNPNTVFEYAICADCAENMRESFSKTSLEKIDAYFENRVDNVQRSVDIFMNNGHKTEKWLEHCMIKNTAQNTLKEYQIYGEFIGSQLLHGPSLFLLSGEAIEELSELLSPQTLGEIDDFVGEFFGLPPEFEEAWKNRDVVLI